MFKEFGERIQRASRVGLVLRMIDEGLVIQNIMSISGTEHEEKYQTGITLKAYFSAVYHAAPERLSGGKLELQDIQDAFVYHIKKNKSNPEKLKLLTHPLLKATLVAARLRVPEAGDRAANMINDSIDAAVKPQDIQDISTLRNDLKRLIDNIKTR